MKRQTLAARWFVLEQRTCKVVSEHAGAASASAEASRLARGGGEYLVVKSLAAYVGTKFWFVQEDAR